MTAHIARGSEKLARAQGYKAGTFPHNQSISRAKSQEKRLTWDRRTVRLQLLQVKLQPLDDQMISLDFLFEML